MCRPPCDTLTWILWGRIPGSAAAGYMGILLVAFPAFTVAALQFPPALSEASLACVLASGAACFVRPCDKTQAGRWARGLAVQVRTDAGESRGKAADQASCLWLPVGIPRFSLSAAGSGVCSSQSVLPALQ